MSEAMDRIYIKIEDDSSKAVSSIEKLRKTLKSLNKVIEKMNFTKLQEGLSDIAKAAMGASESSAAVKEMVDSVKGLSTIKSAGKLGTIAKNLKQLQDAASGINITTFQKLKMLKSSASGFSEIGKSNLRKVIRDIKALADVTQKLDDTTLDEFARKMKIAGDAVRPFATEMQKVYMGMSSLPSKIQSIIKANNALSRSNTKVSGTFRLMGAGIRKAKAVAIGLTAAYHKVKQVMGGFIEESNKFIEDYNLFVVSMGRYAKQAEKYANQVSKVMGIDVAEWMRAQGVFMQIATAFGVVEEKAYKMSKGLTQISYDISSFFNIPIEDALEKVESGIAGEIRPLRMLGYTLEQATLQHIALKYGITQSVETMTQAQKGILRYAAIIQQSKNIMGDLGRTLITPANAIRIMQQQFVQLKRAIGNLLLPIIIKALPYIQAFVALLTEAAQKLAAYFGFKLPKIDYSNIKELHAEVGGTAEGLSESADNAKKLKGILAGFDQLNLLGSPSAAGVGGAGISSGISSNDLPIDIQDYDFLGKANSEVEKIKKSMRGWFDGMTKWAVGFWKNIKGIGAGFKAVVDFVGWLIVNLPTVLKIAELIAKVWLAKALFTGIAKFAGFITDIISKKAGAEALSTAFGGIGEKLKGMPTWAKAAAVAIGGVINFKVAKSNVYEMLAGKKSIAWGLTEIVAVGGSVIGMLTLIAGPWGALAGAIGLAAGALFGFVQYQEEVKQKAFDAAIINEYGESLESVFSRINAVNFEPAIQKLEKLNDLMGKEIDTAPISESLNDMITNIASFDVTPITDKTGAVIATMGELFSGTKTYSDELRSSVVVLSDESKAKFSEMTTEALRLADAIKNNLKVNADVALMGIKELMGDTAKEFGLDIQGMITAVEEYKRTVGIATDESSKLIQTLNQKIMDGTATAGDIEAYTKELGFLSDVSFNADKNVAKMNATLRSAFEGINLKSVGDVKQFLKDVEDASTNALTSINDFYNAEILNIETMAGQLDAMLKHGKITADQYKEMIAPLADAADSLNEKRKEKIEELRIQVVGEVSKIYSSVDEAQKKAVDALLAKSTFWDDLQKFFVGEDHFVANTYNKVYNSFNKPIYEAMDELTQNLGTESKKGITQFGDGLTKGMKETMDRLLPRFKQQGQDSVESFKKGIEIKTEDVLKEVEKQSSGVIEQYQKTLDENTLKSIGASLVTSLTGGINSLAKSLYDTAKGTAELTTEEYNKAFGITSGKSTVFDSMGGYISSSLRDSVTNNTSSITEAVGKQVEAIKTQYSTKLEMRGQKSGFFSKIGGWISDSLGGGILGGLDSVTKKIGTFFDGVVGSVNKKVGEITSSLNTVNAKVIQVNNDVNNSNSFGRFHNVDNQKAGRNYHMYASGGFPTVGEMFIAREAGPEMVGTIGGKTAVANNGQIVAAVSEGVYNAVVSAMKASSGGTSSQSTESVLVLDDIQFGRVVKKAVNNLQKQTGTAILG